MWRSAFPEYPQVSVLRIINMDRSATECLTSVLAMFLGFMQNATLQLYRRNVPLLQTLTQHPGASLHMISFSRPSFVLILQATNAGVKKPVYEARYYMFSTWMKILRLKYSVLTCAD